MKKVDRILDTGPIAYAANNAGSSEKSNLINGGINIGIGNSKNISTVANAPNIPVTAIVLILNFVLFIVIVSPDMIILPFLSKDFKFVRQKFLQNFIIVLYKKKSCPFIYINDRASDLITYLISS